MLELILDKEFLENLYLTFKDENPLHQDFEYFLRKVKHFTLISNYESFEQLQKDALGNPLLKYLLFGTNSTKVPKLKLGLDFSETLKNQNFYREGSPFKLFMLESAPENIEEDYGFVCLQAQNIDPKWQIFNSEREDLALPVDSKSTLRFDSWAKIAAFKHPCHSIIIFDRFLFALFSSRNHQLASLEQNLYAFFQHFISDKPMNKPLQITILTEENKIFIDDNTSKSCRVAKQRLKIFINEHFPQLNTEISVIPYDKFAQDESEHDRGIYTNYFFIKIGKGINLFDPEGNISNRSDIEFKFLFRPIEHNLALSGLRSFQAYLDQVNHPRPHLLTPDFNQT